MCQVTRRVNRDSCTFWQSSCDVSSGGQTIEHHHQEEEARVCELGGMRERGAVLRSFIDWFLLVRCSLLGLSLSRVSCLVCVVASPSLGLALGG